MPSELGVAIGSNGRLNTDQIDIYGTSPGSSPRASVLSLDSHLASPQSSGSATFPLEKDVSRNSQRTNGGRVGSPGERDRHCRAASEQDRKKASPLARRLGEEPPFMLPHPTKSDSTSQTYPGVVIGSFAGAGDNAGLGFGVDVSMDDILDTSAAPAPQNRQRSTSGQAGANIAPWLMDDNSSNGSFSAPAPDMENNATPKIPSMQPLNHFASVPALPKLRRQATDISTSGQSLASSHSGIDTATELPSGATLASGGPSRSRAASSESVQTLGARQRPSQTSHITVGPTAARHASVAAAGRLSRFGSIASNGSAASSGSERKKGFLGGFLKKKTGAVTSTSEPCLERMLTS